MDGLPEQLAPDFGAVRQQTRVTSQHTLKAPIGCVGVGLHSGRRVRLTLRPAPANTGIVFRRTDLSGPSGSVGILARFDNVAETRLSTLLAHPDHPNVRVGTVEHLMAAIAGCDIDNCIVELDGPEVPVLDGSAAAFVFLLECAGFAAQDAPRAVIQVLRPIRVEQNEAFAELHPADADVSAFDGLDMAMSIAFDAVAIGSQALSMRLSQDSFRQELSRARTFVQLGEIEALKNAGLALGGSLDNAVVVDGPKVLNPAGLRMTDEFVRHKLLDAVGDLALAGAPLAGRFIGHRSGHALNNRLLRTLFADPTAWRRTQAAERTFWLSAA